MERAYHRAVLSSDSWGGARKEGERAAPRQRAERASSQTGAASEGSRREHRQADGGAALRPARASAAQAFESSYDSIAALYDPWSASVKEDVDFYVVEARKAGGPIVELGVGTGRIAVPTAQAGVHVIGVDSSEGMLEICRKRAEAAGVSGLLDLRLGDLRRPPVRERVNLVTCPFRALLHMQSDEERLEALRAVYGLLVPGGRFVFDVFAPSREDVEETHARWLEREPGIWERADWDLERQVLTLSVKGETGSTRMRLAWLTPERWRALLEQAGFDVVALYDCFTHQAPNDASLRHFWVARKGR
jgi:SAM-dependent methyltransferase